MNDVRSNFWGTESGDKQRSFLCLLGHHHFLLTRPFIPLISHRIRWKHEIFVASLDATVPIERIERGRDNCSTCRNSRVLWSLSCILSSKRNTQGTNNEVPIVAFPFDGNGRRWRSEARHLGTYIVGIAINTITTTSVFFLYLFSFFCKRVLFPSFPPADWLERWP
jgi:hypothetical protein